jgi:hypothetical protein
VVRAKADDVFALPSPRPVADPDPERLLPPSAFANDQLPPSQVPVPIPGPTPEAVDQCCPHECFACEDSGKVLDRLYGSAEYLLWWIRDTRVPPLITTSPVASQGILGMPGTAILLGGSPLNNDERSGARVTLGYWLDACKTWGIEGSAFFLEDKNVSSTFSSNEFPLLARPFFNLNAMTEFAQVATSPGIATGSITTDLSSRLWGAEANVRANLCCGCDYRVDLLGGFRYLDLEEGLHITENLLGQAGAGQFAGSSIVVADRFDTHNQFYGGQLGAVAEYHLGPWFVDVRGKVGLGVTHQVVDINGSQTITSPAGAVSVFQGGLLALNSNIGHFSRDRFAVVPEVGINLGYQLTNHIRVFAGYNFLLWTNVLRPGDQIDRGLDITRIPNFGIAATPLPVPRPAVPFKETDFWAQGVNFGLEFRY